MSTDTIKRCPFCGGEAYLETIPNLASNEYVVCCKNKKCIGFYIGYGDIGLYGTREGAIQAWNTRKPMERIVERLEEKKKDICGSYNYATPVLERPSCKIAFNNGICEAIKIVKAGGSCD